MRKQPTQLVDFALVAVPLAVLLVVACDPKPDPAGSSETSSAVSSSSTTESTPVLGEPTQQGDPICAAYTTEETCTGEVAPSIFCKWQRTAFLPEGNETCEMLQLSAGCFAYDTTSSDPGCATPSECETPLEFARPLGRAIEGGWLVVNSCGSTPINGFEACQVGESAPLGCRCVCDLAQ